MASSADIYTEPPDTSYLLLKPFDMPVGSHTVWAMAFSSRSGALITAALSVMLTVTFLSLWKLACFVALLCPGNTSRSRFAALAVLWNSNEAGFALFKMLNYTFHHLGQRGDRIFGLIWVAVSLVIWGGSIALGVVGPSLVLIGSAAPVRPSIIYYPAAVERADDYNGLAKVFRITSSSYIRALGSVEAVDVTKRRNVNVQDGNPEGFTSDNNAHHMHQVNYSYSITGNEFGLQHANELSLSVKGSCITEYGWDATDLSNPDYDAYYLWNKRTQENEFRVPLDDLSINNGPRASFMLHPEWADQYDSDGNISFAIVPWFAHRPSVENSQTDPWYQTEMVPEGAANFLLGAKFWVMRQRPVLTCWQQDIWSYGSTHKGTITSLKNMANDLGPDAIKIPVVLLDVLELAVSLPVILSLANACGDSVLLSRYTSVNGLIDASASSIHDDLERLILASYVATQNTFLDTTMYKNDDSHKNLLLGPDKQPLPGAGDFVIVSPRIQTFSMVGLIVIAAVMVLLLIIQGFLAALIRRYQAPTKAGDDPTKKSLMRPKALSTLALFRRVYEPPTISSNNKSAVTSSYLDPGWPCDVHWPGHDDVKEFELESCPKTTPWCTGHINRTVSTGPAPTPSALPAGEAPSVSQTGGNKTKQEDHVSVASVPSPPLT